MKKRTGAPWMSADAYAATLSGLVVNLLVADMQQALKFQREVLQATIVYADEDFAAIEFDSARWMLHADHSYSDHPLSGMIADDDKSGGKNIEGRGIGAELRVFGRNPDEAVEAARVHGFTVLDGAMDKPHGTREAFILDDEGYLWSPTVLLLS